LKRQIQKIKGVPLQKEIQFSPSHLLWRKHGPNKNPVKTSKRGSLDIFAEILSSCKSGISKTRIMHANNLNYTKLLSKLEILTSRGLLMLEGKKYTTTAKGFAFLELFTQLQEMLEETETRRFSARYSAFTVEPFKLALS